MPTQDFNQKSIDEFLDLVADRTPAPGGGAVSAAVGALSAALARMVTAYSINSKTPEASRQSLTQVAASLHTVDQLLRALITQDAQAYQTMTVAADAAKADPGSRAAYQDAVMAAIAVPMEVAAVSVRLLESLDEMKERASRYLLSDLGVVAIVAAAAAEAAQYMIRVNLSEIDQESTRHKLLHDGLELTRRAAGLRRSIEDYVSRQLEPSAERGR